MFKSGSYSQCYHDWESQDISKGLESLLGNFRRSTGLPGHQGIEGSNGFGRRTISN